MSAAVVLISLVVVSLAALVGLAQVMAVLGGAQLVSTPRSAYDTILRLSNLRSGERFLELGSGLGHVAAYVADHSPAAVTGLDISWLWVILSRLIHRRSRANFQIGSVYAADFASADVVYCYLLPSMLQRLESRFATTLKPGSRVISYSFPLLDRSPIRVIRRSNQHGPLFLYRY